MCMNSHTVLFRMVCIIPVYQISHSMAKLYKICCNVLHHLLVHVAH